MGAMGGGGPQTLFGYQLATNQRGTVALAAGIGEHDFPEHCRAWLEQVLRQQQQRGVGVNQPTQSA